ncbi:MAG TPA: HipA domain-containing protein [Pseudoduganella sp.]|jgi:serine/threonine-protein kinase HipA
MVTACTVFDCSNPADPIPAGSFALDDAGNGHFAYGRHYIHKPESFDLDPIHLRRSAAVQFLPRRADGTYGVLSDAGPNAWGVRLTASMFARQRQPLPANPVEWLLHGWHHGSGCLGFSTHHTEKPAAPLAPMETVELSAKLASAIGRMAIDPDSVMLTDADIRLIAPGSSLGGVRPKTVVTHEGTEHIAKFSRPDDLFDVPRVEYATMCLAHRAGITTPDFELIELGGRSVFLIERFDRTKEGGRMHYISAHSLLAPAPLSPDGRELRTTFSYAGIAEVMRPFGSRGQRDYHQLFRRMVFNILVGNVDDHLRNHALLMESPGNYVLSPAFDIVPHPSAATHPQSIGVGAAGAASTTDNALSQCGRFLLKKEEAVEIVASVREVVSGWRQGFAEAGVGRSDLGILATCISAAR